MNVLFGRKKAKYSNEAFSSSKADLSAIRDKVYLKLVDDCEDPAIMSNQTLVNTCEFIGEFSFDSSQARLVKDIYDQVIRRAHTFSSEQIAEICKVFDNIHKLSDLKFVPDVKNDMKKKLSNTTANAIIADHIGLDAQYMNFMPDMNRLTLNIVGKRVILQSISNTGIEDMEKVVRIMSRERIDYVLLCLPREHPEMELFKDEKSVQNELKRYT